MRIMYYVELFVVPLSAISASIANSPSAAIFIISCLKFLSFFSAFWDTSEPPCSYVMFYVISQVILCSVELHMFAVKISVVVYMLCV